MGGLPQVQCPAEDYDPPPVGARFIASILGHCGIYRVYRHVPIFVYEPAYEPRWRDDPPGREQLVVDVGVETKSGLLWSGHISGGLLSLHGNASSVQDAVGVWRTVYESIPAPKTYRLRTLDKDERASANYAPGEDVHNQKAPA